MKKHLLAAAAAAAFALGVAGAADADVANFDISVFNAGFTGPLGTVTVTDNGTSTLVFSIDLADNVYFQLAGGAGSLHDSVFFDLAGNPAVTFNVTDPAGGTYPTGGLFSGAQGGSYGQGFLNGYDYAVQVSDSQNPKDYFGGLLSFTVTATGGEILSVASLGSRDVNGTDVFGGIDIRQCLPTANTCVTGPAGFTGGDNTPGGNVPEPATWAMMIMGFGGVGALMRRRRELTLA